MFAVRLLRVPLTAVATSSSPARIPRFGKFDHFHTRLKLEGLISRELYTLPKVSCETFVLRRFRQCAQKLCNPGSKFAIGIIVVCGAVGSTSLWPRHAYCAEGSHLLDDNSQIVPWGSPPPEERRFSRIISLMHKILVPLFLFLTLWMKWGQIHPLFLTARVLLIFLCTKPIPSSVHIFVDQLQHQVTSQQPLLYRFKPLHANKVEVDDYTLLCVAKVDIKDERLLLIGILGSWWILPISSWKEVFVFDKLSRKELISLVKSRFRLAVTMSWY